MFLIDLGVEVELGERTYLDDDALISDRASLVGVHVVGENEHSSVLYLDELQLC